MIFDNKLLIQMYLEYDITCDRLVSNPAVLQRFTQDYSGRIGKDVEPASLSHHLLNLRRLGEDKGGLPRLRRNYSGRKLTKPLLNLKETVSGHKVWSNF